MILETLNGPKDLKQLNIEQLNVLAQEIRDALMFKLTKKGGHVGPNFGMVEMEIALHYVFDSPVDKIIFDISHQTYPHKMLTGRQQAFLDEDHFADISGYTDPHESEHDHFMLGHTSTSISLASGMAKARDLAHRDENIIAIMGDGSLSGGEALEGLNVCGSELNSNMIIIINDNQQSIAENHGGLYENLAQLRATNGECENNLFKAMGLDYLYVNQGNDIQTLINVFNQVKDIDHPIVLHINTIKGKGFEIAETNKEPWHYHGPFSLEEQDNDSQVSVSYASITSDFLLEEMKKDEKVVVVTPGVPGAFGFDQTKRKQAGKQFVDVGIAEQQATSMVTGLAQNGAKPVLISSVTFMQRAVDQISHDMCLNNVPATILLNGGSLNAFRDATHLGIFGISMFSHIPNLVLLAPTNVEEYLSMLKYSIHQTKYPVMILLPGNGLVYSNKPVDTNYDNINQYQVTHQGSEVAIIAAGGFYQHGEALLEAINQELGINPTLINPRFLSGLDKDLLEQLKANHQLVITIEDGIKEGGFGSSIASFYGPSLVKVINYGVDKVFYDRFDPGQLLIDNGMSINQIVNDIKEALK